MNLNQKALDLEKNSIPYAWATVVTVTGSAPRNAGAKMIVTQNETFGTVGGGSLEHKVISDAREQLRLRQPKKINYPLDESHGQACGGIVDIFIEPVSPPRKAIIFGAGHIGEILVPLLKQMGFTVTLVDEREGRVNLEAFSAADKIINKKPNDAFGEIIFSDDLYVFVMTHGHIHDEEIVRHCLDKPFKYLGLISSRKKWELFKDHFKSDGFTTEQISKVTTPIGLDIGAETPFEIAVSIIAEVIKSYGTPKGFEEFKQCKK